MSEREIPESELEAQHRESEAEMRAWQDLLVAARCFAADAGDYTNHEQLVRAVDALVDTKIERALWEYSQRIEASLGVLP